MATCAERIQDYMASAMQDINEIVDYADDDDYEKYEELYDNYMEGVLNIQAPAWNVENINPHTVFIVQVQLSWGGPADGFIVELDSDGNIIGVRYYFQDWFDYAEQVLIVSEQENFDTVWGEILGDYVYSNMDELLDYMQELKDSDVDNETDDEDDYNWEDEGDEDE